MENRIEKQIDDLVGVFTDPIIVWPGGWAETLPGTIKSDITIHRLVQLMKGEELASWPEVCAYMYTVTLEHPVASEWVDIYMYAMTQYKKDAMPEDIRQDHLDDYKMSMLTRFRRWIYECWLKARKEKQRAEKQKEREEKKAREPVQQALPLVFEAEYEPVQAATSEHEAL